MARQLRIEFEGAIYHVTSRGNARGRIFFSDLDRDGFLDILAQTVERYGWLCHSYCLMPNHYHLLIETPIANLSRGMRHLNGVYTQWVNRRLRRAGHIFQGRFKSVLVEKESHLLELTRYIVLNPVRAKMVRFVQDWRWSSYPATAGHIDTPCFLTTEWILSQFSDDPFQAVRAYREFVRQGRGTRIWDDLRKGSILGSEAFVEQLAPLLHDAATDIEFSRDERLAVRPRLDDIFKEAHDKKTRDRLIHQAVRLYEYTLKEVAAATGLHYSTISVIAKRVDLARRQK